MRQRGSPDDVPFDQQTPVRREYGLPVGVIQHDGREHLQQTVLSALPRTTAQRRTLILLSSSFCTRQPFARRAAGATRSLQGTVPQSSCAFFSPRSSPGTPTARPPQRAASGCPTYIVSVAASGATSRKSIVYTSEAFPEAFFADGGTRTVMKPPPPMPDLRAGEQGDVPRRTGYAREHVHDADAERRAHRGVDRVAAALERGDADVRAELVLARDRAVPRLDEVRRVALARPGAARRARGEAHARVGLAAPCVVRRRADERYRDEGREQAVPPGAGAAWRGVGVVVAVEGEHGRGRGLGVEAVRHSGDQLRGSGDGRPVRSCVVPCRVRVPARRLQLAGRVEADKHTRVMLLGQQRASRPSRPRLPPCSICATILPQSRNASNIFSALLAPTLAFGVRSMAVSERRPKRAVGDSFFRSPPLSRPHASTTRLNTDPNLTAPGMFASPQRTAQEADENAVLRECSMDFTEIYKQTAGLVAFSPGTHFILTAVQDRIVVRRADSFQITRTWRISEASDPAAQAGASSPSAWITHAGWSCDSEYILAACAKKGVVEVFKLRDEAWNARIDCGAEGLVKAEWTPDGRSILCFSEWGVGSAPSLHGSG